MNMFRQHLSRERPSRCLVPSRVYQVRRSTDEGLAAAGTFIAHLATEMKSILGAVGTNDSMADLLQNSSYCWDWATLVHHPATSNHVVAFNAVCTALRLLP